MTGFTVHFYSGTRLVDTVIVEGVSDEDAREQALERTTAGDECETVVTPLPAMVAA